VSESTEAPTNAGSRGARDPDEVAGTLSPVV